MPTAIRDIPPYAQGNQRRPKGEKLHVFVVLVIIISGLIYIERRPTDVVAVGAQNVDLHVINGVATVLLVQGIRSRGVAVLMHALGRAAVPGEVLLLRPIQGAQVPRALLVGCRCDVGVVVVVEEDCVAGNVCDGPVERVRQFAVEGCEFVALWVAACGEVARFGCVGATGTDARAEVAAVVIVHIEDESCWHGWNCCCLWPARGFEDHGAVGGVDWRS